MGLTPDAAGGDLGCDCLQVLRELVSQARSWCGRVPHLSSCAAGVAVEGLPVDPPILGCEPVTHGRSQQLYLS